MPNPRYEEPSVSTRASIRLDEVEPVAPFMGESPVDWGLPPPPPLSAFTAVDLRELSALAVTATSQRRDVWVAAWQSGSASSLQVEAILHQSLVHS